MTRRFYFRFTLALLAALPGSTQKRPNEVVVIVHPSNRFDSLSRSQLNYLYFRKVSRWPWGAEAEPIDLPANDTVRREFTRELLRTAEAHLDTYWIDQRATHGLTPPAVVPDPAAAKAFVAAHPGAIGYIPAAALDNTVKVIKVEP